VLVGPCWLSTTDELNPASVTCLQDVHHGNGTQHILEDDPSIMYMSLHRYDGCALCLRCYLLSRPRLGWMRVSG
jgi:Histone deacetylase domain